MERIPQTLASARDRYLERATLKSRHTVAAYRRGIALFLEFLEATAGRGPLPIQSIEAPVAELPLSSLSAGDAPILLAFAEWLLSESGYAAATVRLRLAGVGRWLQYLDDYGWLPPEFPLAKAQRMVRDELRAHHQTGGTAPEPPAGIEEILAYYGTLPLPSRLVELDADNPRRVKWELIRRRNHALVLTLAESGGRVSEVLSLDLTDLAVRDLQPPFSRIVRVRVIGKGKHPYDLRFHKALPALAAYIAARGPDLKAEKGRVPVFVSHDPRAYGNRMSRTAAWRVVAGAARGCGFRRIHPHDLRHWRATQLVNAGQPLDVVQDYLGHRSVETTRAYYARTDPRRVDAAAMNTPINEE